MDAKAEKRSRKRFRRFFAVIAVLLLSALVFGLYVSDYYHADTAAIAALAPANAVERREDRHTVAFIPENPSAGFIFYPGGKVEAEAYAPLMEACAARGILCVLTKMPFRLAVLDIGAAKGIQEQFPAVERWYIGGHSLGGAMASCYLAMHKSAFEGLILLGAYSSVDLSDAAVRALSVYGSEDRVLNLEKYEKYRSNLPADVTEVVIEGGCHAYFGMYGPQKGDGAPAITNLAQIRRTADAIAAMITSQEQTEDAGSYDRAA